MTRTASLENCRAVYEALGFDDGDLPHHLYGEKRVDRLFDHDLKGADKKEDTDYCPLYDTDFLLEKLPMFLGLKSYGLQLTPFDNSKWWAKYPDEGYRGLADTPADALCLLALALAKAGVLGKTA